MTGSPDVRPGSRASAGGELGRRLLPPAALAVFGLANAVMLAIAGETRGYDLRAYLLAAHRLLDGVRLYDTNADVAGPFGLFLYPPPFAIAMVPFALVPESVATWCWTALLAAAFLAGAALLPVRREVRWLTVLLAGLSWPLLYSIKLGQVGPLLFLGFAIGWRALDRPVPFGLAAAAGTLIKVQPAVLFGWAVATRRPRAIAAGLAGLIGVSLASAIIVGPQAWVDFVTLLVRVGSPIATPHTVSLGTLAYGAGLPLMAATVLQWLSIAVVLGVMVWTWFRRDVESSLLMTIVASQLLSPILWDHYAMLLLLPAAFLLQRGERAAAALPLLPWLSFVSPWIYPIVFALAIAGLLRRSTPRLAHAS